MKAPCRVCGAIRTASTGGCTNCLCAKCHARFCTPGGVDGPGHEVNVAKARARLGLGPDLVRVPARFYDDHRDRALPTPEQMKGGPREVWVRLDDPALPELLDDARHYAHPSGPDNCPPGIIMSAKATVRAIEAALKGQA